MAGTAAPIASLTELIVTGSLETLVFLIVTVNVTEPPGSLTLVGVAVLLTWIVGATSSRVTTAESEAAGAAVPSSSWALAVTVSVWLAPALPLTLPLNEQMRSPAGAIRRTAVAQVLALTAGLDQSRRLP